MPDRLDQAWSYLHEAMGLPYPGRKPPEMLVDTPEAPQAPTTAEAEAQAALRRQYRKALTP